MSFTNFKQIKNGAIVGLIVAAIVGAFSWLYSLKQDISGLQRKYSYLVGYLSARDNINLTSYFNVSGKKVINQKKVIPGAYLLKNDPVKAKTYLEHKLNFTPAEAKQSLSQPAFIGSPQCSSVLDQPSKKVDFSRCSNGCHLIGGLKR